MVTVIIPCYNQSHYLKECLQSVIAQTYTAWQAIVIDDASPDANLISEVIDKLGDDRIRLVHHKKNSGLAASRNTGFRASGADFVLPLDSDDKIFPDCLQEFASVIASDDKLDCVYGDVQLFGRRTDVLQFPGPPPGEKMMTAVHTLPGAGTMLRKKYWEKLGGYDESPEIRHGREDFEFWMRAFHLGCKFKRIPKLTYEYRISHSSMSVECNLKDEVVGRYIYNKNRHIFESKKQGKQFLAKFLQRSAIASHYRHDYGKAIRVALSALWNARDMDRLATVGKTLFPRNWVQNLNKGEIRRRIPFSSYPIRSKQRYAPFFIIGVGRSGNTLFRRILTSHSQLYIPPETFVLGEVIQTYKQYSSRMNWHDLVYFILSKFEFHPEFYTFDTWLGPLVNRLIYVPGSQRNLAFILDNFYQFHAETQKKSMLRWGDKTPMNSLDDALVRGDKPDIGKGVPETLLRIKEVFPDAQFLQITRDGCDVAFSFLRGGFVSSVEEAAKRWLHTNKQTSNFVERFPEQCHAVRYEDIVAFPEQTIQRVCDFLQVDFEPEILSSNHIAAGLGDVPAWSWHQQVNAPINSRNPGKGRAYLSEAQKEAVQKTIGDELERLGYQAATAKPKLTGKHINEES